MSVNFVADSVLESEGPLASLLGLFQGADVGFGNEGEGQRRVRNRISTRHEFPYRLKLEPFEDGEDFVRSNTEQYVQGRDISDEGFGFYHEEPLPYKKVYLTAADHRLDRLGLDDLKLLLTLRWCRFIRPGLYECGGKITWA